MASDTRDALLDAAKRAILADGYAGASTRRIAGEASVPLSLLHYHFGGKAGLLVALVERERDRNRASVAAALLGDGPPAARVAGALAAARHAFLDDESTVRLLLEMAVAALHNQPLRAEVQRLYGDTITAMGRTAALLSASDAANRGVSTDAVAALLMAAGFGLALQQMLGVEVAAADAAFRLLGQTIVRHFAEAQESATPRGGAR